MKTQLFFLKALLLFLYSSFLFGQSNNPNGIELSVKNESSLTIRVKFYPVSMVFTRKSPNEYIFGHKLKAAYPYRVNIGGTITGYDFVNGTGIGTRDIGGTELKTTWTLQPGQQLNFNWDYTGNSGHASFGSGIFKMIIDWNSVPPPEGQEPIGTIDSLLIDYDFPSTESYYGDNAVHFRNSGNDPRTLFEYQGEPEENWIRINRLIPSSYYFKPYEQFGFTRGYGNFITLVLIL